MHPIGIAATKPCRTEGDRLYTGPGGYDMKAGIYLAPDGAARPGLRPQAPRCRWTFWWCLTKKPATTHRACTSKPLPATRYGLVCEAARANGGKCVTARKGTGMLRLGVKGRAARRCAA